jgi:hypothetical protein
MKTIVPAVGSFARSRSAASSPAVAIFALYHVLALLIAVLRAPRRERPPARVTVAEARRGN